MLPDGRPVEVSVLYNPAGPDSWAKRPCHTCTATDLAGDAAASASRSHNCRLYLYRSREEDELGDELQLSDVSLLLDQSRDQPELLEALLRDLRADSSGGSSGTSSRYLYDSILSVAAHSGLLSSKLQLLQDRSNTLQYLLLKACAGMAGPHSLTELQQVLQQIRMHNWAVLQDTGLGSGSDFVIDVAEVRENWFLRRSPLALLVSRVKVWGPGGDQQPGQPLPPAERARMVQLLLEEAPSVQPQLLGKSGVKQRLLKAVNRNRATPFFTGCHFCELEALAVLCREVPWRLMLQGTKRALADKLAAVPYAQMQNMKARIVAVQQRGYHLRQQPVQTPQDMQKDMLQWLNAQPELFGFRSIRAARCSDASQQQQP
eukprot:gene4429-4683_t